MSPSPCILGPFLHAAQILHHALEYIRILGRCDDVKAKLPIVIKSIPDADPLGQACVEERIGSTGDALSAVRLDLANISDFRALCKTLLMRASAGSKGPFSQFVDFALYLRRALPLYLTPAPSKPELPKTLAALWRSWGASVAASGLDVDARHPRSSRCYTTTATTPR